MQDVQRSLLVIGRAALASPLVACTSTEPPPKTEPRPKPELVRTNGERTTAEEPEGREQDPPEKPELRVRPVSCDSGHLCDSQSDALVDAPRFGRPGPEVTRAAAVDAWAGIITPMLDELLGPPRQAYRSPFAPT